MAENVFRRGDQFYLDHKTLKIGKSKLLFFVVGEYYKERYEAISGIMYKATIRFPSIDGIIGLNHCPPTRHLVDVQEWAKNQLASVNIRFPLVVPIPVSPEGDTTLGA